MARTAVTRWSSAESGAVVAKVVDVLTTGNMVRGPRGTHIDKADRSAIAECCPVSSGSPIIYAYKHPRTRSLG